MKETLRGRSLLRVLKPLAHQDLVHRRCRNSQQAGRSGIRHAKLSYEFSGKLSADG
jgi:hypothetical protein